jgi:hypothetical protein
MKAGFALDPLDHLDGEVEERGLVQELAAVSMGR